MRTDTEAQNRVSRLIGDIGFPETIERLKVNKGLVYRVWKEGLYSPTVRRALKLPVELVPAPPCPDCGKVHVTPWCVQKNGAPVPETEVRVIRETVYVEKPPAPKPKRNPAPKRYRSSYEHGRGGAGRASKAQLEAEMRAAGCESFSDYVDLLRAAVDAGGDRVATLMRMIDKEMDDEH